MAHVAEEVDEARQLLQTGHRLLASLKLGHVVEETDDPQLLHQIEELGEEGLVDAGVFDRPAWTHIIHEADVREHAQHQPETPPARLQR